MISLESVGKSFAGQIVLENASLQIVARDRVGIVGPNGSGKSTVLRMIVGSEHPDQGSVAIARDLQLGHLAQELTVDTGATVLETALRVTGRLAAIEAELERLPEAIAQSDNQEERHRLAARLGEAHALYDQLGGHDRVTRARRVLAGLGFGTDDEQRLLKTFSGGFAMRAELARLLVDQPDVLLLDEPTNHLDLESVLWLQEFLVAYPGALVVVSHDRAFLSATVSSIVELEDRRLTRYAGSYEDYVRERDARRARLEAAARNQERRIRETERFIDRFRYKATKAAQVQSRVKALAREERITVARQGPRVRFRFPQPERTAEVAIELCGVTKSYGDRHVYQELDFRVRRSEKTVLVGPNGAGKSTLLKLLAGAIAPDAGERRLGLKVTTGYYSQHRHEMLDLGATVLDNARAVARDQTETFVRSLLGAFLFRGDDVKKKAAVLSGGEKSRLALARILLDPPSVLLMDEPTIHLDMASADALISALAEFEGALCFVSHDVYFIRRIASRVVRVEDGELTDYGGDWDYHCWKRGRAGTAESAGPNQPKPEEDASNSDGAGASIARTARGLREERRRAAEARNSLARRTRALRDELAALEDEIGELEREKAGIEGDLADPTTYQQASADVGALRRRHAELDRTLVAGMQRWAEARAELEAEIEATGGNTEGRSGNE